MTSVSHVSVLCIVQILLLSPYLFARTYYLYF